MKKKIKEKIVMKLTDEDQAKFMNLSFSTNSINYELDRLIERRLKEHQEIWEYITKKYNLDKDRRWTWNGKQEVYIDESKEGMKQ